MPGMTGLDMARRMLELRPGLPVILCTGYSNLVNEAQARECGTALRELLGEPKKIGGLMMWRVPLRDTDTNPYAFRRPAVPDDMEDDLP